VDVDNLYISQPDNGEQVGSNHTQTKYNKHIFFSKGPSPRKREAWRLCECQDDSKPSFIFSEDDFL
jgi:hypothetical protein